MTGRSTPAAIIMALAIGTILAGCSGGRAVTPGDVGAVATTPRADADAGGQTGADGPVEVEPTPEPVRPTVEIPTDWPTEIEEVYGRYWLYWDAFAAAHAPPAADPTFGPLEELSTPGNWASLQDQLRAFARDGLVLELPERSITEHLLRLPEAAVLDGTEGEEIVLQDCWIDDFVQRSIDGTVLAEARGATLMNVVMRVVGGEWRVDGVTRASPESDGVEQCAELIS